jgi:hypothetical protein
LISANVQFYRQHFTLLDLKGGFRFEAKSSALRADNSFQILRAGLVGDDEPPASATSAWAGLKRKKKGAPGGSTDAPHAPNREVWTGGRELR